jgi:hypothetical protein
MTRKGIETRKLSGRMGIQKNEGEKGTDGKNRYSYNKTKEMH